MSRCMLFIAALLTVEVDEELLRWSTDGDVSGPLQVTLLIDSRFFLPLLVVGRVGAVRARGLNLSSLERC